MLTYPNIDPIAFQIGSLTIRWYGLMYLFGFLGCYLLAFYRRNIPAKPWKGEEIADMLFYIALGVIFGGRIGFVLVYQPGLLLSEPWTLFEFWVPGRSFHGGLVGVILTGWFFAHIKQRTLRDVMDFIAPVVPLAIAAGRLGNFLNGELWGRPTDMPWGMVFPHVDQLARHPSQLYEFLLEGVVMLVALMWYARKRRPTGSVSGLFLILYGAFRFWVEFYRQPDLDQGFIFGWLTMGQILSIPMLLLGVGLMVLARNRG